jgi:hypothetical protein
MTEVDNGQAFRLPVVFPRLFWDLVSGHRGLGHYGAFVWFGPIAREMYRPDSLRPILLCYQPMGDIALFTVSFPHIFHHSSAFIRPFCT